MSDPTLERLHAQYDTVAKDYEAAASRFAAEERAKDERLRKGEELLPGTVDRIMGALDEMGRLADTKESVLQKMKDRLDKIKRLNTRGHPRSVPIVGRPAPRTIATEHNK